MNISPTGGSPIDRDALSRIRNRLTSASKSSGQAQDQFDSLQSQTDWWGFGSMSDDLAEATRDTEEIDSSGYGRDVLDQMGDLESLQSNLSRLADFGGASHRDTVQELKEAVYQARNKGVPDDLRREIESALYTAEGGDRSAEGAESHIRDSSSSASDVAYGASQVSDDELPGEWSRGDDVSNSAWSAKDSLDDTQDHLREAGRDAYDASSVHGQVDYLTTQAISTLDGYLAMKPIAVLENPVVTSDATPVSEPSSYEAPVPPDVPPTPSRRGMPYGTFSPSMGPVPWATPIPPTEQVRIDAQGRRWTRYGV